jgi:UDP-N-acetylmuramoylalanine--D-glutamate ligase
MSLKPFIKTLNGKPVGIFGLGMSGLSAVRALVKDGARVLAWDDEEEKRKEAERAGATLHNFQRDGMGGVACLILSPGVQLNHNPHKVVDVARGENVEIIGDLEVLHRTDHGHQTIGITGTNGKSTTTALIGHILKECGKPVSVGGNIGVPALELKLPSQPGFIVLEISSYQMDLCTTFRPDISIHLNLTVDHIDHHGSMEAYGAAKARIFDGPGSAICGIDDSYSAAMADAVKKTGDRKLIPISVVKEVDGGVFVMNTMLYDDIHESRREVGSVDGIRTLLGAHNHQNICAAYAACRQAGLSTEEILAAIKTYPGLPHRQFPTRTINGVAYVNDSKATNADATSKALASFRNIYWIVGGRQKDGGLNGLEEYMDRIRHAYVIGEAMEDFAVWLDKNKVQHSLSKTLDFAVLEAHRGAQLTRGEPGGTGTVLLSPACASWDQFRNFEHRGDTFTDLVNTLSEDVDV